MADYRIHTTKQGERWDAIAYRHYSDPYQIPRILEANPSQYGKLTPDVGILLQIPILNTTRTTPVIAPPWDRNS